MKWAAKASLSLVAISSLLVGAAASAGEFGFAVGGYSPHSGREDRGKLGSITLLVSDPEDHWRWGGELEYRNYEIEIEDISNLESQDVLLNAVIHYRFWPARITPYIGIGAGIGLNIFDEKSLERQIGIARSLNINKVGFLLGASAIVGLEFPIGSHFSIFFEGRGSIYSRIEDNTDFNYHTTSGWDGRGGIKRRF